MNYTKLFYWLTVADNAKIFFLTCAIVFSAIGLISMIWFLTAGMEEYDSTKVEKTRAKTRKWVFWSWPFMLVFWSLWIFTPTKRDALLIVAGGGVMNFLSTDSSARQIPHEFVDFVKVNLENMAEETKVELGLASQKDKILEEAKKMTAQELMDKMKVDSTFAKIILNK